MLANTLFTSWVRVTIVWWLGAFIWWGFSNELISTAFNSLPDLFFQYSAPKCELPNIVCTSDGEVSVTPLTAVYVIGYLISFWTIPVLLSISLSGILGSSVAAVSRYSKNKEEEKRLDADEHWRGMGISLGTLPRPIWHASSDPVKVNFDASLQDKMKVLEPRHKQVFAEIIGYLHAHPDSFVGDGHKGTLLEHSLRVVEASLEEAGDEMDPLLPLAAAAHDMGKTVSHYKSDSGEWLRRSGIQGLHDHQGGLLVSALPSFLKLDDEERMILTFVTKYAHKPYLVPYPDNRTRDRMAELFKAFNGADHDVTANEKKEVIQELRDTRTLDQIITDAFFEAVTTFRFQSPNLPKSQRAIGWRKGSQLILIEIQFREKFASLLPPDLLAAWGGIQRTQNSLAGVTKNLLDWLDEKGWLVREVEVYKSPDDEEPFKREVSPGGHYPLWSLYSGKKVFKGVYIVEIPEEFWSKLPVETQFDLKFFGFMKPPKQERGSRPKHDKGSSLALQLQKKRKNRLAAEKRDQDAFEKRLSEQSEVVQDKFRKQRARFKGAGGLGINDDSILDSVIASVNAPVSKPADKVTKPTDPRAAADFERSKAEPERVFDTLDDESKKEARALVNKSLNAGKALSLEQAAESIQSDNLSASAKSESKKEKNSTQPDRRKGSKDETRDTTETKQKHSPGVDFLDLSAEEKRLANKIISKSLNAGVAITKDEAAAQVRNNSDPCAEETAKDYDSKETKGQKFPEATKERTTWASLSPDQKKGAMKLLEAELNKGVIKPDRDAIAEKFVMDSQLNHSSVHDDDPTNEKPKDQAERKPGNSNKGKVRVNQRDVKATIASLSPEQKKLHRKYMSEALNSGAKPDQAQILSRVISEDDIESGNKIASSDNEKQKPSDQDAPARNVGRNKSKSEGANDSINHKKADSADTENASKNDGAVSNTKTSSNESLVQQDGQNSDAPLPRKKKRRRKPKRNKSEGNVSEVTSGNNNQPQSKAGDTQEAQTTTLREDAVEKQRTGSTPEKSVVSDTDNSSFEEHGESHKQDGIIPKMSDPFGDTTIEIPSVVGAAKGKSGEAAVLELLTHKEMISLRRELNAAQNSGKTGVAVNRVAIAERIIAERDNPEVNAHPIKPEAHHGSGKVQDNESKS